MTAANQSTSTNGSESSNPKCGGETKVKRGPTLELVIPTWPHRSGEAFHGDSYAGGQIPGCDSFRIPLRCRENGNTSSHWLGDDARDWDDFCIYVWHSPSAVQIRVEVYQLHSADTRKLERLLKKHKWVDKKLDGFESGTMERLLFTLVDLMGRLGIKRSIQYADGINKPETFVPILEALIPIVKQAERRAANYRGSYAA